MRKYFPAFGSTTVSLSYWTAGAKTRAAARSGKFKLEFAGTGGDDRPAAAAAREEDDRLIRVGGTRSRTWMAEQKE